MKHILSASLLLACCASLLRAHDIRIAEGDHVDVSQAGKLAAKLMMAHDTSSPERQHETYKPYLHVYGPDGVTRLTKGAGFSFTHHRGIFLGFSKIAHEGKTYDRWHMKGGDQVVTSVKPGESSFTAQIDWQGATAAPFVKEEREFRFTAPAAPFYLGVEMRSSLRPVSGKAEFGGDPEHAGAQFRPSELVDTKATTYLFPGAETNPKKAKDLPWAAEIFTVEGKTFTVAILNHPDNPQGTVFSAYRDYGRFGAFPQAAATPESPLRLRYQWLAAEGAVRDAAVFQKAWNAFAGKNDPVPALTEKPADQQKPKPKTK